jgi:type II secretory pathway pseudopilin PulG
LIELLVVISIFLILASLLTSSLNKMVNQGRALHDSGRLRSLYKALVLYHDDNTRFPLSQSRGVRENNWDWDTWMIKLAYYFNDNFDKRNIKVTDKANFLSAHNDVDIKNASPWNENTISTNFGTIEGFMPWRANTWGFYGLVSTDIKRPHQFVALMDTKMRLERNNTSSYMVWGEFRSWWWHTWTWCDADKAKNSDVTIPIDDSMYYIDFRQNNKNNFIFSDGHVESLDPFDVKYMYFSNNY